MASNWADWIRTGSWAHEHQAQIPALPARAQDLIQMANDPDVTVIDIARIVTTDPVLTMQVIRMANSAWSAPSKSITSVTEAVGRIGTEAVRNLVLASFMKAQMTGARVYGPAGATIVDHSIGTALLTIVLSPERNRGELFLGGLLHDVGKLLILKLAHDNRKQFPDLTKDELTASIKDRHPHMGGWLAARWQLPEGLSDLIAWHHDPEWAINPELVSVIHGANRLAYRYGFGGRPETADLVSDPIFRDLGIDDARLAYLDAQKSKLFETAQSMFGRRH